MRAGDDSRTSGLYDRAKRPSGAVSQRQAPATSTPSTGCAPSRRLHLLRGVCHDRQGSPPGLAEPHAFIAHIRRLVAASVLGAVVGLGAGAPAVASRQAAMPSILGGTPRPTTFAQVTQAVDALYRHHPGITAFTIQAVQYTPKTRDKVLKVCRDGSIAANARELETERVMACAPLIYFFASYGRRKAAPEAIGVARTLYWYAVTHNRRPYDATPVLAALLRSWGIR